MEPQDLPDTTADRREFLASLAAFALGCSPRFAAADFSTEPARLKARVAAPRRAISPGSHDLGLAAGKDGLLYVPRSYRPAQAMPLVVLLHGAGGTAANWFGSYGQRAEALGVIMLAPESRGPTWDAIQGNFGRDVTFVDSALRYTFERCAIDARRIALAGFSDGASYAISLGLPNGDLFSHVIAYSPGFIRQQNPTGRPLVYVSHGTNDAILPINATSRVIVPRAANARLYRRVHGVYGRARGAGDDLDSGAGLVSESVIRPGERAPRMESERARLLQHCHRVCCAARALDDATSVCLDRAGSMRAG